MFWLNLSDGVCRLGVDSLPQSYFSITNLGNHFLCKLPPFSFHCSFSLHLILIFDVTGPNLRYKCNGRGVQACELDGAWGVNLLFEVFEYGGLHLVVTKVVPVGGGANKTKKEFLCYLVFE